MSFSRELGILSEGRSQILTAPEGSATLVLQDADEVEVLRIPVFLEPDGVNRLDV